MPIDAEAYMAGAIPTLSRGGSWLPHTDHPTSDAGTSAPFPQSVHPHATANSTAFGGIPQHALGGMMQNPLMFGRMAAFGGAGTAMPGQVVYGGRPSGSQYAASARGGMLSMPSPNVQPLGSATVSMPSPTSPVKPFSVSADQKTKSTQSTVSPTHYMSWAGAGGNTPKRPGLTHRRSTSDSVTLSMATSVSSHQQGSGYRSKEPVKSGSWDRQAGSPKPLPAEADYRTMRIGGTSEVSKSFSNRGQTKGGSLPVRGSDIEVDAEAQRRHHSQPRMKRPSRLSGLHVSVGNREQPVPSPLRSARRRVVSSLADVPEILPSKSGVVSKTRVHISQDDDQLVVTSLDSVPPPTSKHVQFQQPKPMRRHTEHPAKSGGVGIQLASNDRKVPPTEWRIRQDSTPQSCVPPHTPPTVFEMQSMASTLPSPSNGLDHIPYPEIRRGDKPRGYISPLADEWYDRYTAHPAVHSPTTIHRSPSAVSLGGGLNEVRSEMTLKPVSGTSQLEYLPLGYARPTRELEWNRDGPAMKTYGIAWKREAEVLPAGPEGPSWIQARPPRGKQVSGGSYWERGGQGQ